MWFEHLKRALLCEIVLHLSSGEKGRMGGELGYSEKSRELKSKIGPKYKRRVRARRGTAGIGQPVCE
jgi:hypothetical protein